nr:DUF6442 family protein [uncultured Treponema sp.]
MTKEEILEISRNENQNKDLADLEAVNKGSKIAFIVGFTLCVIIASLDIFFNDHIDERIWMIFTGMFSAMFLTKFIMKRKTHELIVFIVYILFFLLSTVAFCARLLGIIR